MFDIGFSEIMVVSVISLVIMGPERLPETVRTLTLWLGRLRQFVSSARAEIEDEVGIDEIRRQLRNEKIMRDLEKSKDELSLLAKNVTDVKNEKIMRDLEKTKDELAGLAKDATDINQIDIKDELDGLTEDITKISHAESKND
jgi:sec-independent protein translocase protein TatB